MATIWSYTNRTSRGRLAYTSVNTPGFSELKANGAELPYNPHTWLRETESTPVFEEGSEHWPGGITYREAAGAPQILRSATISGQINNLAYESESVPMRKKMVDEVSLRLLSKARNIDLNLGVAMGEFPETADFVRDAMVRTARAYRFLRRGKVQRALDTLTGRKGTNWKDIPGALADSWLAYAFGFRPIAQDVYSACKILERGLLAGPKPIEFRASKEQKFDVEGKWSTGGYNRVFGDIRVTARMRVLISNPDLYTMEQLGVTNPLNIAWELVPFSFVVDWFLPVGEYIQNIFPPQGLEFVKGYTYEKLEGGAEFRTHGPPDDFGSIVYTSGRTWEKVKVRNVLTGFPTLKLTVPDLSLSKSQVATGMALLYKVLERR